MKRGRSTGTPNMAEKLRFARIKETDLVPIPEFPHTYVSAVGDVYSDHPGNRWGGKLHRLKPSDNGRGYLRVRCHGKSRCIHVLVAATFLGHKPDGMEINHKDGDKTNNRPKNLEYVTRSENVLHCHLIGLGNPPMGESHHQAKVTAEQVRQMRAEYESLRVDGRLPNGEMKRMQMKYGMSDNAIASICRRKTWRSVL